LNSTNTSNEPRVPAIDNNLDTLQSNGSSTHTTTQTHNSSTKSNKEKILKFHNQNFNTATNKKSTPTPYNSKTRTTKSSLLAPQKSSLSNNTAINIGKPIISFKAHNYQIYLVITKQEKKKEVNAITIAHMILKTIQLHNASEEIFTPRPIRR
jgi:hypothetical protein